MPSHGALAPCRCVHSRWCLEAPPIHQCREGNTPWSTCGPYLSLDCPTPLIVQVWLLQNFLSSTSTSVPSGHRASSL